MTLIRFDVSGTGMFLVDGGSMVFNCIDFDQGDAFTGTVRLDDGDLEINDCGAVFPKPDLSGATLDINDGMFDMDNGFVADGSTVTVTDGSVFSYGDITLANTSLTVDGTAFVYMSTATLIFDDEVDMSVEDTAEVQIDGDLSTGVNGDNITITVADDGEMSCHHFTMSDTEVAIEGLFTVDEGSGFANEATDCSFSVHTGGTWVIRWGFDGTTCELNILGGTIVIPADTNSLTWTFDNAGPFLCTGGVISVEEPETFHAVP